MQAIDMDTSALDISELKKITEKLVGIPKGWRALMEQRMEPYGLSQAKWLALYKLDEAGQPLPQVDLAARIGIEPATLVRLLDRMEAEGWISRQADAHDRRCKLVVLQPHAQTVLPGVKTTLDELRSEVMSALNSEELTAFRQALTKLQDRIATLNTKESI